MSTFVKTNKDIKITAGEFIFLFDNDKKIWTASLIYSKDDMMIFNDATGEIIIDSMTPNFAKKCVKKFNEFHNCPDR